MHRTLKERVKKGIQEIQHNVDVLWEEVDVWRKMIRKNCEAFILISYWTKDT